MEKARGITLLERMIRDAIMEMDRETPGGFLCCGITESLLRFIHVSVLCLLLAAAALIGRMSRRGMRV